MSRNKIGANTSIFRVLDQYCADRGDPIRNSGEARWIASLGADREFLVYAEMVRMLQLSPTMRAAQFDFREYSYLVTAGFESIGPPDGFQAEDPSGGVLTAFLYETSLHPIATSTQIREVVEALDNRNPEYQGHAPALICSLFREIQVFIRESIPAEEAAKSFLLLCLADRRRYEHWIDAELAQTLKSLISVSTNAIPYELLCRAVLDTDPGSLFLALYRSLEALYSREQTTAFISAIGASGDWVDMAEKLERHLGWYPREEPSLEAILQHSDKADLGRVIDALGEELPEGAEIVRFSTRKIYALRNSLVHYRPFHQTFSSERIDWCQLCMAMTSIVLGAYESSTVRAGAPAEQLEGAVVRLSIGEIASRSALRVDVPLPAAPESSSPNQGCAVTVPNESERR